MTVTNPVLWAHVQEYPIPYRSQSDRIMHRLGASFIDNVRRNGDWTHESATRLVVEYRRFLYLQAVQSERLVPPGVVQGVMDLHRSMDANFATLFGQRVGRMIDFAIPLSDSERLAAYGAALALYQREFGLPPQDIWPTLARYRLAQRVQVLPWIGLALIGFSVILLLFVASRNVELPHDGFLEKAMKTVGVSGIVACVVATLCGPREPPKVPSGD